MEEEKYQSEIERCHNKYCESALDDFLNGKTTKCSFLHFYYNALIPLSQNYNFRIPQRVKKAVDILEEYNKNN